MAPGEKKLLKQSLKKDGLHNHWWCQKRRVIIWWWMVFTTVIEQGGGYRKTSEGMVASACINQERKGQASRIAATIRQTGPGGNTR